DEPARRDTLLRRGLCTEHLSAHRFDNRGEGLLHVADLFDLVVAPGEVETENRDAELVDALRVYVAPAILVRDHLAAAGKVDVSAILLADGVFQFLAVAFVARTLSAEAELGHIESAANFDVIAARKILILVAVEPPRNIYVHAADPV